MRGLFLFGAVVRAEAIRALGGPDWAMDTIGATRTSVIAPSKGAAGERLGGAAGQRIFSMIQIDDSGVKNRQLVLS